MRLFARFHAWWVPSIRWKMVATFIAISVVPMLVATYVATQVVSAAFRSDVEAWLFQTSRFFLANIFDEENETAHIADTLVKDGRLDPIFSGQSKKLLEDAQQLIEVLGYDVLIIFDVNDKIIFSSKPLDEITGVPFTNGKSIFLYKARATSTLLAAGTRQIDYRGKRFRVLLGTMIDKSFITNMNAIASLVIRLNYRVDGKFVQVYSSKDEAEQPISSKIEEAILNKRYDGSYLSADENDERQSIGIYVPLTTAGEVVGVIFCGLQSDTGLNVFLKRQDLFLGIFASGMLLSIAGGLILARLVTNPVVRLAQGVNAIAKGDFDQRIPVQRHDELGQLAIAFNSMARQLQGLRKLEAKMRRSERMATLGEVAAGLAHEVRNPLGIIKTSAELLERSPNRTDVEARRLGYVVDEVRRIDQLIRDFLSFAKPPQKLISIGARQLIDHVLGICQSEIERCGAVVSVDDETDHAWLKVDVDQMVQACLNIILNAVQAMEQAPSPRRLTLEIRLSVQDDEVHLLFADNGPGVPTQLLPRIFDPFVTGKSSGTGLGLAQVFAVAEGHGGWIEARNAEAGGAEFELVLPRLEMETVDVAHDLGR